MKRTRVPCLFLVSLAWAMSFSEAFGNQAARDLGIRIGPYPTGKWNSISDVKGVKVGHVTLISGSGKMRVGNGPTRTGVTVVIPGAGDLWDSGLMAGSFVANGNGEAMGMAWLQESGALEGPIAITNTLSVSAVQRGLVDWTLARHPDVSSLMPLVFECDDSSLNDIHGHHIKPDHVKQAIANSSEEFAEGSVGAGTGMVSFDFKSGIGSSSRVVRVNVENEKPPKEYTIGVLVNSNIGTETRGIFRLGGVAVSQWIPDLMPTEHPFDGRKGAGSAVFIVATDAPMDSLQLNRIAKRAIHSLGRLGTVIYNGSGEFSLAFSTANRIPNGSKRPTTTIERLSNSLMNDFFEAVVDAGEEAVINSLLNAKDMEGRDGNKVFALPSDKIKLLLSEKAETSVLQSKQRSR